MSPEILKEKKREIPTGKGRELSEALREHLIVFQEVKNTVAFVNPAFTYEFTSRKGKNKKMNPPFKLEKLGLFAKSPYLENFPLKTDEKRLETLPAHHRSSILGRIIFRDKEGRFYRDVDLKGVGHIVSKYVIGTPGERRDADEFYGFLEKNAALKDYQMEEKFVREGIRTVRTLAIINLEEIIVEGKKVSLEEARKKKIISERFQPVVQVRAFGAKARISDILATGLKEETRKILLDDTKKLVSQEIGSDLSDTKNYLNWFTKTLGRNLGLLNKTGLGHYNLDPHNITLDCRIVDFDTVRKIKNNDFIIYDQGRAINSIETLAIELGAEKHFGEFKNQFFRSYDAVFPEAERVNLFK